MPAQKRPVSSASRKKMPGEADPTREQRDLSAWSTVWCPKRTCGRPYVSARGERGQGRTRGKIWRGAARYGGAAAHCVFTRFYTLFATPLVFLTCALPGVVGIDVLAECIAARALGSTIPLVDSAVPDCSLVYDAENSCLMSFSSRYREKDFESLSPVTSDP